MRAPRGPPRPPAGLLSGGLFLAFGLSLLVWFPAARTPAPYVYALFVDAYAIASRVEFEVGPGFAIPTQLSRADALRAAAPRG